ncbi:MAG: hypothetical protein AAFN74_11355 [Myxococcota bacterium]
MPRRTRPSDADREMDADDISGAVRDKRAGWRAGAARGRRRNRRYERRLTDELTRGDSAAPHTEAPHTGAPEDDDIGEDAQRG